MVEASPTCEPAVDYQCVNGDEGALCACPPLPIAVTRDVRAWRLREHCCGDIRLALTVDDDWLSCIHCSNGIGDCRIHACSDGSD